MEHRGKGAEGISTGGYDLTHHVDGDGTGLTDGHADLRTTVALTQRTTDLSIGGINSKTTDMNGTKARHNDRAIGRHLQLLRFCRSAIDINEHLVARTYHITGRGSDVHIGFERELVVVEDITAKDVLAINGIVGWIDINLGAGSGVNGRGRCLHVLSGEGITCRIRTNSAIGIAETAVLYQHIGAGAAGTGGAAAIERFVL